jgi:hypothetical protein
MHAASTPRVSSKPRASRKAARRVSSRWLGGHPHRLARRSEQNDRPLIVRFPVNPEEETRETARSRENAIARRIEQVRASWSPGERERRRLLALERQEELLMLLAAGDLEQTIRSAVAQGEQPVCPPEVAALYG